MRLAPDDVTAQNNLGVALLRTGQRSAAIAHFHEALRLQPCVTTARNNLELLGDLTATATCGPAADSASAADPEGKVLPHQQAPAPP